MFSADQYELLDFGHGRKLERFGPWVVDRPSPAAEPFVPKRPLSHWQADLRFDKSSGERGAWSGRDPGSWTIRHGSLVLELRPNEFGHLGVFPEQAANWDWIAERIRTAGRGLKILNLFAYTGGSTLAAAAAGADVVHIDAAPNVVQWARRNAELSGLAAAPIRWIAEDAGKFVARELRRGNRYDAVILDPPSYGHGPRGEVWKLETDLERLVRACGELTEPSRKFILLTCHSPGVTPATLRALATELIGPASRRLATGELVLATSDHHKLPSGTFLRWL